MLFEVVYREHMSDGLDGAFAMDTAVPVVKSPISFIVRCFAERRGDQWLAFSVEFGLAAQADTCNEVEAKLESMISCYIEDALGQDRRYARALLGRRAIPSVRFKYYLYSLVCRFRSKKNDSGRFVFDEPMRLAPVAGCPA